MKKGDRSKVDKEEPDGVIIYKPEEQIFQKLHLCECLGELFEIGEDGKEHGG
jgi:hypothetical protein